MDYLQIDNLIVDGVSLSLTFKGGESVGFIGDNKTIEKIFLYLSGVNNSKGRVLFNGKDVFDNDNYFKSRIIIDFKKRYITTLKKESISEAFKNKFDISVDMEKMVRHVKEFSLRKEAIFDVKYTFTEFGNTLLNYSLVDAISVDRMFLINPLYKVEDSKLKEKLIKGLISKKYKNLFIEVNDIYSCKMLDYYVFLDKGEAKVVSCDSEVYLYQKGASLTPLLEKGDYLVSLEKREEHSLFSKKFYKRMKFKDALIALEGDSNEKE